MSVSRLIIMKEKTLDFFTTPFIKIKFYIKIKNMLSLMLYPMNSLSTLSASSPKSSPKSALKPTPVTMKTTSGSSMMILMEFQRKFKSPFRKNSQNYNCWKKEEFKKPSLPWRRNSTKNTKREKPRKSRGVFLNRFVKETKPKTSPKIMGKRLFLSLLNPIKR